MRVLTWNLNGCLCHWASTFEQAGVRLSDLSVFVDAGGIQAPRSIKCSVDRVNARSLDPLELLRFQRRLRHKDMFDPDPVALATVIGKVVDPMVE